MCSGRSRYLFLGVLIAAVLANSVVRSAELMPLRATYSSIGGAFAPLWLAVDKGLFAKYGLAVDMKYLLSATGTQALLSGSVDIVNPATEIIEAGLGGARVAFIIGILNRAVLSIYSKPEFKQLTDLRGKVFGVTLPGSTTDLTAKILFQQAGMVSGKDVQITHLQGMPDIITALSAGTYRRRGGFRALNVEAAPSRAQRIDRRRREKCPDDPRRIGDHAGLHQGQSRQSAALCTGLY